MSFLLHPSQVFGALLVEWVRHEQAKVIEYLKLENEILREELGNKRVLLNDEQRRLLAVKGMALGQDLEKYATIAQPDTIRRWHRELIAPHRYKNPDRRTGRPSTNQEIVEFVLRLAGENPSWGYKRIEGALSNVGYEICSSTVANILKHHGIEPTPQRKRQLSWGTFIKAHLDAFEGVDLSKVFDQLVAGVLAWLMSLAVAICDPWFEFKRARDETRRVPDGDTSIYRFPDAENVELQVISCAAAGVESLQIIRGPPTSCHHLNLPSPIVLAKAA